jgi:hypothetical protein
LKTAEFCFLMRDKANLDVPRAIEHFLSPVHQEQYQKSKAASSSAPASASAEADSSTPVSESGRGGSVHSGSGSADNTPSAASADSCDAASGDSPSRVLWQWQESDAVWVSYLAEYSKAIEKKYTAFVTEQDKPQRVFISLDVGHGPFTYQIDFLCDAPAPASASDAPAAFPLCSVAGSQTNQKTQKVRLIRRCASPARPAVHLRQQF